MPLYDPPVHTSPPQTSAHKKPDFHILHAHPSSQSYTHFTRHFTKPKIYFKPTTVVIFL